MLRNVWWEFLCSIKKSRFIIVMLVMLYFSCISIVEHEGVWRFQKVVQMFCILIIIGDAFYYHTEQTIPRVFFYVPRQTRGAESLRQYIKLRCIVEVATFFLLSLMADGVSSLFHILVRHEQMYLGVPGIQLMHFLLFVLCLTYFRVGAFHKTLVQHWMFYGKGTPFHFIMVAVTAITFYFSECIIDSSIGGELPSKGCYIVLGGIVFLCLLHTIYFSHRCIVEMSMAEVGH